jgi:hypothetical protein
MEESFPPGPNIAGLSPVSASAHHCLGLPTPLAIVCANDDLIRPNAVIGLEIGDGTAEIAKLVAARQPFGPEYAP